MPPTVRCKLPEPGRGGTPAAAILLHLRLLRKHLVIYIIQHFLANDLTFSCTCHCIIELARITPRGYGQIIDSTLKQLTLAGYQILVLYF